MNAYASAMLSGKMGSAKAKELGDAHEKDHPPTTPKEVADSARDQKGNASGRACGEQFKACKKKSRRLKLKDHARSCCIAAIPEMPGHEEKSECDDIIGDPPPPPQ